MATLTVNPSASAIDEQVFNGLVESWTLLHAETNGTFAALGSTLTTNSSQLPFMRTHATTVNKYNGISRTIFQFDTSALSATAIISSAVLSVFGGTNTDGLGISPAYNIFGATPSSHTATTLSDYSKLGTTAYCDTAIAGSSWANGSYNDFILNATGIAAINKTGVSAFGFRESIYDATGTDPGWPGLNKQSNILGSYSGGTNKPKLVITYTSITPNLLPFFMSA